MSGHSKWSTIKRKKEATDQARGKLFSKLARAISIAIKTGGGSNPDTNYKLRVAIDQARAQNMPKENVDRALRQAQAKMEDIEEAVYEVIGPGGMGVIIETVTDNRNRTVAELKKIIERGGGRLGGPGSVAFNFEPKGLLAIKKLSDAESQLLSLIDLGVEDIEETDDAIEVYTNPTKLSETRGKILAGGFEVMSAELVQKPKNYQKISDIVKAKKTLSLLENLEEHDDVQKVFSNVDIPEEIVSKINI